MTTKERQKKQREQILYEQQAPAFQQRITNHVRAYCGERYDDPETMERDMCKALGGIHCVAIDSPYSHAERSESLCKRFNKLPAIEGLIIPTTQAKQCAYCQKAFTPKGNRQKYCSADCSSAARKQQDAARKRSARN